MTSAGDRPAAEGGRYLTLSLSTRALAGRPLTTVGWKK